MNTIDKAVKVERALRQLRSELIAAKQYIQTNAINEYLLVANEDNKARLYDLLISQIKGTGND